MNIALLLMVFSIIAYFSIVPYTFLSYDSYMNVLVGKEIAYIGAFQNTISRLTMFSLLSPLWQTTASMFGVPLNYAIQPVFASTGGILTLVYLQIKILNRKGISNEISTMLSILVVASIFTVPEVIINFTWILNNLDIGIMYGIAIALFIRYQHYETSAYLYLSFALIIITGIVRIEGGVFVILLLILVFTSSVTLHMKKSLITLCSLIYMFLNLYYFLNIKDIEEGFWSPRNAVISSFLLVAVMVIVYLEKYWRQRFNILVENIDLLMLITIIVSVIFMSVLNPTKAMLNAGNLMMNVVSTGYYGISFIGVLLIIVCYQSKKIIISKELRFLLINISSYILLIFLMMLISIHSSRVGGYGDSTCRMLLHITPTVGILLTQILTETMVPSRRRVNNING